MAGLTTDTNKTMAVKIFYSKSFKEPFPENLNLYNLAQKETQVLKAGAGNIAEWTRILKFDEVTSALTEGSSGSASDWAYNIAQATIYEWGDYKEFSERFKFTNIDPKLTMMSHQNGDQASRTMELNTVKEHGLYGGIPILASNSVSDEFHDVTLTTATSGTSVAATAISGKANDYFNTGRMCFTDSKASCYGEARPVTDFVGSSSTFTLSPTTTNDPSTSSKMSVAALKNLTNLHIINTTAVRRAVMRLRKYQIPTYKNGYFIGFLDPETEDDFFEDDLWKELNVRHASAPKGLFKNEVGSIAGVAFSRTSKLFRCEAATGTTYSATGTIHGVPIFGKHCMGVVDCEGQGLHVVFGDPKNVDPALQRKSSMGWVAMIGQKALNSACSAIVWCGSQN